MSTIQAVDGRLELASAAAGPSAPVRDRPAARRRAASNRGSRQHLVAADGSNEIDELPNTTVPDATALTGSIDAGRTCTTRGISVTRCSPSMAAARAAARRLRQPRQHTGGDLRLDQRRSTLVKRPRCRRPASWPSTLAPSRPRLVDGHRHRTSSWSSSRAASSNAWPGRLHLGSGDDSGVEQRRGRARPVVRSPLGRRSMAAHPLVSGHAVTSPEPQQAWHQWAARSPQRSWLGTLQDFPDPPEGMSYKSACFWSLTIRC